MVVSCPTSAQFRWKDIRPIKEQTDQNLCLPYLGLIPRASQFKIEYFAPTNLQHLWFCHHLSDMAEGMTSPTDLRYILYSTCVNGTYTYTLLNLGYGQKPQWRLGEKTPTPNYLAQPRNPYKRSSSRCPQTLSAQQSPVEASEAVTEGRKEDVSKFLRFSGKNLNSEFIFPQFDRDIFTF